MSERGVDETRRRRGRGSAEEAATTPLTLTDLASSTTTYPDAGVGVGVGGGGVGGGATGLQGEGDIEEGHRGLLQRLFSRGHPDEAVQEQDEAATYHSGREEIYMGTFGRSSSSSGSPPQLPRPAMFPSSSPASSTTTTPPLPSGAGQPTGASLPSSKRKREDPLDPRAHWAGNDDVASPAGPARLSVPPVAALSRDRKMREASSSTGHNTFGDHGREGSISSSQGEAASSSAEADPAYDTPAVDTTSASRETQRRIGGDGASADESGNVGRGERGGLGFEPLQRVWTPEQEEQRMERRQEEQRLLRQSLSSDSNVGSQPVFGQALRPTSASSSRGLSTASDERRRTPSSLMTDRQSMNGRNRLSSTSRNADAVVGAVDPAAIHKTRSRTFSEPKSVLSSSTDGMTISAPAPALVVPHGPTLSSSVAAFGEQGPHTPVPLSAPAQGHARVTSLPSSRPPRTSFQEPREGTPRSPRAGRTQTQSFGGGQHRRSSSVLKRDPLSAQQSPPMTKYFSSGETGFRMSSMDAVTTPGLTAATSERPSWSTMLTQQARAQASYHLAALYALQPRFPPRHSSLYDSIKYETFWPKLHHRLLLLCTYLHVPATIFLDFSALYALVEVAKYPDAGEDSSAAWWIAAGVYAASLLAWLVGVVIVWEVAYQYRSKGAAHTASSTSSDPSKAPSTAFVTPVYLSAPAFTLTAVESLGKYSLLFKTRLAASRRDQLIETFWFYSQNWPTVVTLLPRGIILTVFLVLYHPGQDSTRPPTSMRDDTYFDSASGLLTRFSYVLLLIDIAWMLWRLVVVLGCFLGLFFTTGLRSLFSTNIFKREEETALQPQSTSSRALLMGASQSEQEVSAWTSAPRMDTAAQVEGQGRSSQGARDYEAIGLDEEAAVANEQEMQDRAANARRKNSHKFSRLQPERFTTQHEYVFKPEAWKARAEDRIRNLLLQAEEASGVGGEEDGMMMMAGTFSPATPTPPPIMVSAGPGGILSRSQLSDDLLRTRRRTGTGATATDMEERRRSYLSGEIGPPTTVATTPTPPATNTPSASAPALSPFPGQVSAVFVPSMTPSSNYIEQLESPVTRNSQEERFRDPVASPLYPFPTTAAASSVTVMASDSGVSHGKQHPGSVDHLEPRRSMGESGPSTSQPMASTPPSMHQGSPGPQLATATPISSPSMLTEGLTGEKARAESPTSTSSSSEDSEEQRLWATFPEQSRRHPPGLIALELEEQRRARLEQGSKEKVRAISEDAETPRKAPKDDGANLGAAKAAATPTGSGGGTATERPEETLLPIKEESWGSSLDENVSAAASSAER